METKPKKNKNQVKIIGTSHVSKKSSEEVKKTIENWNPDIIALELDENRLKNLLTNKKTKTKFSIKKLGITTYIFLKLASYLQKKVGANLKIKPGAEMKTAINLARQKNTPIFLIDQNIQVTSQKLSKSFTLKEKLKMFMEPLTPFGKKQEFKNAKKLLTGDLPNEKTLEELINYFKKKYPNIYKVLVEERNQIMCKKIIHITNQHPNNKILVIVGAGHKKGMEKILRNENII